MKGLTEKVLGWNKAKCDITLSVKSSPMYGRVTQDDVNRINAEVLAVAGCGEEMPADSAGPSDDTPSGSVTAP